MSQSLGFFLLSCVFFVVQSQTDKVVQPQNVSLTWKNDIDPQLSWSPVENCSYEVVFQDETSPCSHPTWIIYDAMEGGSLHCTVVTICNGVRSQPFVFNKTYPELVRNLNCYIQSSKKTHCSWLPARPGLDLPFFYRLIMEDGTVSQNNDIAPPLRECSAYTRTEGIRTGCDLQAKAVHTIHILFNDTRNNMPVRNTFKRDLFSHVKLDPLTLNATKMANKVFIFFTPPDIDLSDWKFSIKYNECNVEKHPIIQEKRIAELELLPHCQYCFAIKAESRGKETPWSKGLCFDAEADPNAWVFAAIMIPLVCVCLAVLTFVCFRKNKDTIFPKVPVPRDFLSDISNNNNKSNLYIPREEDDNCKITLVVDPQNCKQYSGDLH